jgi:hypothetical protein
VKRKKKGIKVNLGCLMTKQLRGKRQILLPINNEGISHKKREAKNKGNEKPKKLLFTSFPPKHKKTIAAFLFSPADKPKK